MAALRRGWPGQERSTPDVRQAGKAESLGHPATLVFRASPQAPDPWFVRHSGYPGVGLSLAWESPVAVEPGKPIHRTVSVLIADGFLASQDIDQLIATLGETA